MQTQNQAKLANLLIPGVNKAGTTTLFMYLSTHPSVCTATAKEPYYFMPQVWRESLEPIETYAQYFAHCPDDVPYRLEATPRYLFGGAALAQTIQDIMPGTKSIVMLREPVSRLISRWRFQKTRFYIPADMSLRAYVDQCLSLTHDELFMRDNWRWTGVEDGFYARYLAEWLSAFGDDVRVVFLSHLQSDRDTVLAELANWLQIDPNGFDLGDVAVENKTMHYKQAWLQKLALQVNQSNEKFWRTHPRLKAQLRSAYYRLNGTRAVDEVPDADRAYLQSLYEPRNRDLAHLLLQHGYSDLPDWLAQHISTETHTGLVNDARST